MDRTEYKVVTGGKPATLVTDVEGLELATKTSRASHPWSDVRKAVRRGTDTLVITLAEGMPLWLAFGTTAEREAVFALADGAAATAPPREPARSHSSRAKDVLLLTVPEVPGRVITATAGLVTAQSVMSRNALSDVGSGMKSVFGGALKGAERSVEAAIDSARHDLAVAALNLGSDCVIGVTVSAAAVGENGAHVIVVMAGTAVKTVPRQEQ